MIKNLPYRIKKYKIYMSFACYNSEMFEVSVADSERRKQMREELAAAQQWIRAGEGAVLARVTRVVGSAPRPVGSAMVISSGNKFLGSVSGGCVEGAIIQSAEQVLRDGKAIMMDFSGDGDPLTEIVLGCGGEASIFLERLDKDGTLSPVYAAFLDRFSPDDDGWLMT